MWYDKHAVLRVPINSVSPFFHTSRHEGKNIMCGVVGFWSSEGQAASAAYFGLLALHARGKESAGIASRNAAGMTRIHKGLGTIDRVFADCDLKTLDGNLALGHVRYATSGDNAEPPDVRRKNTQPLAGTFRGQEVLLAHNGNLTNYRTLRKRCESVGYCFSTTSDSEIFLALLARSEADTLEEAFAKDIFPFVEGTYSLVLLYQDALIGIRDPYGNRPLQYGMRDNLAVIASESVALQTLDVECLGDVQPGTMAYFCNGTFSRRSLITSPPTPQYCIFEKIYFSHPASNPDGIRVALAQRRLGRLLARRHPVTGADYVIPMSDSGRQSALGFAEESGIPLAETLIRSHYVGRTFIEPVQDLRTRGVKLKFNYVPEDIAGRTVVIVDDSIVRGTTLRRITNCLVEYCAKAIHLRIASPPIISPCYYGVDMPTHNELIAARCRGDIEAIRQEINPFIKSLAYLSVEETETAIGTTNDPPVPVAHFCNACFTGVYRISLGDIAHSQDF